MAREQPAAHRLARPVARLASGPVSDLVLTILSLLLLADPFFGGARTFWLGMQVSTPSFWSVLPGWLAIVALRAAWRRWQGGWPAAVAERIRRHRVELTVAALTLAGLALRIWGLAFGLPLLLYPDEYSVVGVAIEMLRSGWIDPAWYVYPTFFMNLMLPGLAIQYLIGHAQGLFGSLAEISNRDPGFYWVGRLYAAALGALTIPAAYRLATASFRDGRGRRAGLVAAAIVAFSFIHVRESHYGVTDVPTGLVMTLAMIAIAGVLYRGRTADYAIAGLLCGLAGSTKYTALPILAPLAAAHLLGRPAERWRDRRVVVALGCVVAGFLIGSPYALLNWPPFLQHLGWNGHFAGAATPGRAASLFSQVAGYGMESGFGAPAFLLLVAALVGAIHRRRPASLMLASLLLAAVPLLTQTSHPFFARFLVPLVPTAGVLIGGLIVGAADLLARRVRRPLAGTATVAIVTLLIVQGPLRESIQFDRLMARTDSRTAAYHYIADNYPSGTVVATEVQAFALPEGLDLHIWDPLHERPLREYRRAGVDLIVLDESQDAAPSSLEDAGRVRRQLKRLTELARYGGPGWAGPGPPIVVYRLDAAGDAEPSDDRAAGAGAPRR